MLSFISGIEKLVCILVLNMHIHIKIILPNLNNQKILSFILHVARDLVIIVYVYKIRYSLFYVFISYLSIPWYAFLTNHPWFRTRTIYVNFFLFYSDIEHCDMKCMTTHMIPTQRKKNWIVMRSLFYFEVVRVGG